MKNALIVACVVVTALSMLMCEISPSSAIWRIVSAQQQQEALLVSHNALQIKHNEADGILISHTNQDEEHMVASTIGTTSRGSNINGILFSYPKQEDEHILCSSIVIRGGDTEYALFRMETDEALLTNKKERLVHQAFRIEENTFKQLKNEAAKRGVSISNLVNTTLKNHMTYGMYFEKLGFIPVSKDFMRTIFNRIEREEDIEAYSRDLGNIVVNEYASLFFPKLNRETLIQFLELWLGRFQNCEHRIDVIDGKNNNNNDTRQHTFSINHDINVNLSIVLKRVLAGLIEPITKSIVMFSEETPSTITFSFET